MLQSVVPLILLIVLLTAPQQASAESAEAVIGGQSARVELPDGYCAMSELQPSDARLIEFLRSANQGTNTVRLVFAQCSQLRLWRDGTMETLDDYGYVSTPDRLENTPVNMSLPAFIELMSKSFIGTGMKDFERGVAEGTDRVKDRIPQVQFDEAENLGVIYEDDRAVYLGIIQKIRAAGGAEKVILGSAANTMVNNRVAHMYLYTVFSDEAMATLLRNSRALVDRTISANAR